MENMYKHIQCFSEEKLIDLLIKLVPTQKSVSNIYKTKYHYNKYKSRYVV